MRTRVIINDRSSRTEKHLADLPERLRARGIDFDSIDVCAGEKRLRKLVKRAVRDEIEVLVVGGGDGSMATAVDVLAHAKTALGVLPLGTGNSFALTLSISDDFDAALDTIAAGRIERVDLGTIDDRYFANFAVIGLSAEIAENAPHALKPIIGPAAYVVGGIAPFARHRPFRARVKYDGGKLDIETSQIVVASGRFFGKQPVTPDASITDGRLAFFASEGGSRFDAAKTYLAFALGAQTMLPGAHVFSAKHVSLKTSRRQPIAIDGNAYGRTPAKFGIARGALRVIVPTSFAGTGA